MSNPATSATNKRVRLSNPALAAGKKNQDPITTPANAAKSSITQALASHDSKEKSFFTPLCIELLELQLKLLQKKSTLHRLEDPSFIPRSIRLSTLLVLSNDATDHPEALALRESMKTVVTTYQDSARVVLIHKAAELEVKVLHDTVVQRFVSLLTHICSTSLLAKSADQATTKFTFYFVC
ncbi:hypothetical protein MHU86_25035 [Fragilaria crotonensis]|nr:hypothetical protein MHU86_25035 [Fragilaria crotonensis]